MHVTSKSSQSVSYAGGIAKMIFTDLDALNNFSKQFKLSKLSLGEGSFGQVLKALHHQSGKDVAIKFGKNDESLDHEYKIYELIKLRDSTNLENHIPTIYGFGKIDCLTWLAMDLLGPTIEQMFDTLGTFSIETILMMGIQMIECVEYLHRLQIVHGDIKGDNFAVSATNPKKIMIFDFGLARDTSNAIAGFRGSLLYASIATHQYHPIHPKDDFESLGYLLADYYKSLPWKYGKWPETWKDQVEYGLKQKQDKDIFEMTTGFFELALFLMHVDAKDEPNWKLLTEIFSEKLNEMKSEMNFDWE